MAGAGEWFSEGSHPAQLLLLPFCSPEHHRGCAELAGLTSMTHAERAQGQACPSRQAGSQAVTRCGKPAGRRPPALPAHPTVRGEISLGCCRPGLHPWSSPQSPRGHGITTRGRFNLFSEKPDISGRVSSSQTPACRGLNPEPACSSAVQHGLFPVPVAGTRHSLLLDNKPQEESRKGPTQVILSHILQILSPCSQGKATPLSASGEEGG